MGEDNDLQQFRAVGLVIEQFPQDFQAERRKLLPFVDHQHHELFLLHRLFEQPVFDVLLQLPLARLPFDFRDAEGGADGLEKFKGRGEGGVKDQVGGDKVVLTAEFSE